MASGQNHRGGNEAQIIRPASIAQPKTDHACPRAFATFRSLASADRSRSAESTSTFSVSDSTPFVAFTLHSIWPLSLGSRVFVNAFWRLDLVFADQFAKWQIIRISACLTTRKRQQSTPDKIDLSPSLVRLRSRWKPDPTFCKCKCPQVTRSSPLKRLHLTQTSLCPYHSCRPPGGSIATVVERCCERIALAGGEFAAASHQPVDRPPHKEMKTDEATHGIPWQTEDKTSMRTSIKNTEPDRLARF